MLQFEESISKDCPQIKADAHHRHLKWKAHASWMQVQCKYLGRLTMKILSHHKPLQYALYFFKTSRKTLP